MRYIYQQPDWPKFRWDANALLSPLSEARDHRGRLLGKIESIGLAYANQATNSNLEQEIKATSAIEGVHLDNDEIRSSIARRLNLDTAGMPKPSRDTEAIVAVLMDATIDFKKPIDRERIFAWHRLLFPTGKSDSQKIKVGSWRNDKLGPMQIVSGQIGNETVHFEAPPAREVDREMSRFFQWCQSETAIDALLKAAIAHLWFVTIHPLDDGNGRIGRAISESFLARLDGSSRRYYSMSSHILEQRKEYYEILKLTQLGGLDITNWLLWFINCFDNAITASESRIDIAKKRDTIWASSNYGGLNERQLKVIERLLEGFEGKLTSSKYAVIAKCSQDTAQRDIKGLIDMGFMIQDEGSGRSTSYSVKENL